MLIFIKTDKSTKAYLNFWNLIRPNSFRWSQMVNKKHTAVWEVAVDKVRREKNPKKFEDLLLESLLDINPEGDLLREIRDIEDELNMMTKVFAEQEVVSQDFATHIQQLSDRGVDVTQKTKNAALHLVEEISRRKREIAELTRAASRAADGVSWLRVITSQYLLTISELEELLDLKQKHANIAETRAAISRAEETNKILKVTNQLAEQAAKQTQQGVEEAEQSLKQNRSLMIFTIVTIIFVS